MVRRRAQLLQKTGAAHRIIILCVASTLFCVLFILLQEVVSFFSSFHSTFYPRRAEFIIYKGHRTRNVSSPWQSSISFGLGLTKIFSKRLLNEKPVSRLCRLSGKVRGATLQVTRALPGYCTMSYAHVQTHVHAYRGGVENNRRGPAVSVRRVRVSR